MRREDYDRLAEDRTNRAMRWEELKKRLEEREEFLINIYDAEADLNQAMEKFRRRVDDYNEWEAKTSALERAGIEFPGITPEVGNEESPLGDYLEQATPPEPGIPYGRTPYVLRKGEMDVD